MNSAALAAIVAKVSCVSTLNELTPQELQERRLADSGIAADDQRCALTAPNAVQQRIQRCALFGAPQD
jgi:hypothetical protein